MIANLPIMELCVAGGGGSNHPLLYYCQSRLLCRKRLVIENLAVLKDYGDYSNNENN